MRKPYPVKTCTICGVKRKIKRHVEVQKDLYPLEVMVTANIYIYKNVKYFTTMRHLNYLVDFLAPMSGIVRLCHSCATIIDNLPDNNIFGKKLEAKLVNMLVSLGYKNFYDLDNLIDLTEDSNLYEDGGDVILRKKLSEKDKEVLKTIMADKILKCAIQNKKYKEKQNENI